MCSSPPCSSRSPALSILIANRWYGDDLYVPVFFGIVLGGWILKFVVFIVVLLVLRGQPWVDPTVFFVSVVVSVLASLVVDVVVLHADARAARQRRRAADRPGAHGEV